MSSFNAGEFTDMDGEAIEEADEPLSCPFCDGGADRLIVERWSAEDDPDASYHVECLNAAATALRRRRHSRRRRNGTGGRGRTGNASYTTQVTRYIPTFGFSRLS
jgi:hypothetical protein